MGLSKAEINKKGWEKGIDVSKWQGSIDWGKVKNQVDFAILKVTGKSNQIEPSFQANYDGCVRNNIPLGVYKYVYATNIVKAEEEAKAIVEVLKGKRVQCGVWLDLEDKSIKGLSKHELSCIALAMYNVLSLAGYEVGIYCNKYWYDSILDSKYLSKIFPFWIARYRLMDKGEFKDDYMNPKEWAMCWQYSSKGKIDGIVGNVDLDVCFGNLSELMGVSDSDMFYPAYSGGSGSIQYALSSMGYDGSFKARKKIAEVNEIAGYRGTYSQNIHMLNLLKAGMLKK